MLHRCVEVFYKKLFGSEFFDPLGLKTDWQFLFFHKSLTRKRIGPRGTHVVLNTSVCSQFKRTTLPQTDPAVGLPGALGPRARVVAVEEALGRERGHARSRNRAATASSASVGTGGARLDRKLLWRRAAWSRAEVRALMSNSQFLFAFFSLSSKRCTFKLTETLIFTVVFSVTPEESLYAVYLEFITSGKIIPDLVSKCLR